MTMRPHGTTLIDAAVAKIVGLDGVIDSGNVFRTTGNAHDDWLGNGSSVNAEWTMEWNPSGDMRYAMEAAEKCGLFRFVHHERNPIIFRGSSINPHAWYVSRSEYIDDVIGQGPTLSLAICHAILALHGDK